MYLINLKNVLYVNQILDKYQFYDLLINLFIKIEILIYKIHNKY